MTVDLSGYYGEFSNQYVNNDRCSSNLPLKSRKGFAMPYIYKKEESKAGFIIGALALVTTIIGGISYFKKHPLKISNIKNSICEFFSKIFNRTPKS